MGSDKLSINAGTIDFMLSMAIILFIFMNFLYILAVAKKKYSIVDIGWGLGFILLASMSFAHSPQQTKHVIMLLVVFIWGLRLSSYITIRSWGKPEDPRYAEFRKQWGIHANIKAYFIVFLFQGLLIFIISLPVTMGMHNESRLTFVNYLGLLIWTAGLSLEAYSDFYFNRFKKQKHPPGTICMSGPWEYTRFPNYFGEISLWYGVYLLCFDPHHWWTIIAPIALNLLILKITGVPLLEKKYKDRADYQAYARRVPRLIPFTPPNK